MATSDEIKARIHALRTNPAGIQRYAVDLLEEAGEGKLDLKDPSNPFVFLLEAAAMVGATSMEHCDVVTRSLYPVLAQEYEDLYRHMADNDYLNRFAVPGNGKISLVLSKTDIEKLAISVEGGYYRKITIPRNTFFKVMDYTFGIHYPIDVRIMAHGGLQVVYDTTVLSPLINITDNNITWYSFINGGQEYILVEIPVQQFTLTPHYIPLNVKTGLSQDLGFTDRFYYARVWHRINNSWVEIGTTHSVEVFDLTKPTAQLKVLENQLRVTIPQIYFSQGKMGAEIRVDVYTTKGNVTIDLGNYTDDAYSVKWRDLNGGDKNIYAAPLGQLTTWSLFSDSAVTAGSDGSDFDTMRQRVVDSRARRETPVTFNELKVAIADQGYTLIRSIDNITDRVFHASRTLPAPNKETTPIAGMVETVAYDDETLTSDRIIQHLGAYTLLPDHLYELKDNKVIRLSDEEHRLILAMEPESKVETTNRRRLLYVPCHYILDERDGYLTSTPFLLSAPKMLSRRIKDENMLVDYRMTSDALGIVTTNNGWEITVRLRTSQNIKDLKDDQVHVQLAFVPHLETNRVFLNGTLIGSEAGERVYVFNITSGFDIDRDFRVRLNSFTMFEGDTSDYMSSLMGDYEMIFAISNVGQLPDDGNYTLTKDALGRHLLPDDVYGLTVEHLGLELGQDMSLLLSDSRTSVSSQTYEQYAADVPAFYTEHVYQHDVSGRLVLIDDPDTGRRVPVIEHRSGDPIMDSDGEIVYKYYKGDVKLVNGQPIPIAGRGLLRFADLLLLDARYLLSDNPDQQLYRTRLPEMINAYLQIDLQPISERLLERTVMQYIPKRSIGQVDIIISDSTRRTIDTAQVIDIAFFQGDVAYRDDALKTALTTATRQEVLNWLDNSTLSLSTLISRLKIVAGDNAIGVAAKWAGDISDLDTFTLVDTDAGINISQQLKLQYDNTVLVEDAINVNFIKQTA